MALTPEQRNRVEWLLEGHMDEDLEDHEFDAKWNQLFTEIDSPEGLFLFAYHAHGDTSAVEWRRVIDHPHCGAGTALIVYWRCSPDWHLQFRTRDDPREIDPEGFDLIRDIQHRYLADEFPPDGLSFDHSHFRGGNMLLGDDPSQNVRWVPIGMCTPSPGRPVTPLWGM